MMSSGCWGCIVELQSRLYELTLSQDQFCQATCPFHSEVDVNNSCCLKYRRQAANMFRRMRSIHFVNYLSHMKNPWHRAVWFVSPLQTKFYKADALPSERAGPGPQFKFFITIHRSALPEEVEQDLQSCYPSKENSRWTTAVSWRVSNHTKEASGSFRLSQKLFSILCNPAFPLCQTYFSIPIGISYRFELRGQVDKAVPWQTSFELQLIIILFLNYSFQILLHFFTFSGIVKVGIHLSWIS